MTKVLVAVGTKKGLFLLESDEERRDWQVRGPFCETWPILHACYDPHSGNVYAAGGSPWYGAAVWRSRDLGRSWTHSSQGLSYGDDGPAVEKLWHVAAAHGSVYVGAEPAGLFRSDDQGDTWVHVAGLRNHPTRPDWVPGAGGLCLHTIVPHPTDPAQMWVAASSVGTFFTRDSGQTWTAQNVGLRAGYLPAEKEHEVGFCVHKMVMAPGRPDLLYQQNHQGVYRSADGGGTWAWINEGLPSTFGFPMVAHPRDPETVYVIPLNGDGAGRYMPEGAAAVWRSRNAGTSWERLSAGLPQTGAFMGVLRDAMTTDPLSSSGIYFGTSTGQIFASTDEGENWRLIADFLPSISGLSAAVLEG